MTDEQIIKAWEKVMKMSDEPIGEHWGCTITTQLAKVTYDTLIRQKAEIERLETLYDSAQDRCFEGIAIMLRLRNKVHTAKAEAYKEVFQKLKDKSIMCKVQLYGKGGFFPCLSAVTLRDINLLEKELVGE